MMSSARVLSVAAVVLCALNGVTSQMQAGFTTFFDTTECPSGWAEVPGAQGRVIVSVTSAANAGVQVHSPLGDKEDRTHNHTVAGSVLLPEKDVAAIDCCNTESAKHSTYTFSDASAESHSGLPFVQLILCQLQKNSTTVAVPAGTIGYWSEDTDSCPANWQPLDQAQGRILVGSFVLEGLFISPAASFSSGEDRMHNHTFESKVDVTDVSFVGVEGCCNKDPAASGTFEALAEAESVSLGIPYLQLLTCVYQGDSFKFSVPDDTLLFNSIFCTEGWELAVGFEGRMPVANPPGGEPGATFGGDALPEKAKVQPAHSHPFTTEFSTTSAGVGLASGCCGSGYAGNGQYEVTGVTSNAMAEVPYVMAPLCKQH